MNRLFSTLIILLICATTATAQVFTNKEVVRRTEVIMDSLKQIDYPYSLPILGRQAVQAGYDIPYSAGLSVNYFWQESEILIDNLNVGFNNSPMVNLDGIVRFDNSISTANSVNIRPDIWLFPFLNVYAIFGQARISTEVGFGVWVPTPEGETQILTAGSNVEFNATTFGLGFTPTIGVKGGFIALDMNVAWTDIPELEDPARSFIFGPRLGKNFKLGPPERTVAVWVGGFRVALNSGTAGSLALSDLLSEDQLGGRVEEGIERVEQVTVQVNDWWENLSPIEQNNPVNQAKYNAANNALERAGTILSAAETAINNVENATVQYSLDKRPQDKWNFIVGSQLQWNKHWMIRLEYGFLGTRNQLTTGLQYRFGL
jgi:hypothetical protein